VGINTEAPEGLLHVDAKGDTNGSLNIADDVVITSDGRIGVGMLSPQTRLDIHSSTPGAIRIADGTEGGGKILTSDANGTTSWTNVAGSWYATLKGGQSLGAYSGTIAAMWPPFVYSSSELSPPGTGSVDVVTGIIQVPYTGMYRVTTNGVAYTNLNTTFFLAYGSVMVNGVDQFIPHQHMPKNLGASDFSFIVLLPLNAGDQVTLRPWPGSNSSDYPANQYTNTMLHVEFVK
jgi:hypothetical protein